MPRIGAKIIRTPTEAPHDSPDSNMGKAKSLVSEIHNAVMLDQYGNEANPDAHYFTTAVEIIEAIESTPSTPSHPSSMKCDMFVAGAGTGSVYCNYSMIWY
jgi:cystathionine beta-synthase